MRPSFYLVNHRTAIYILGMGKSERLPMVHLGVRVPEELVRDLDEVAVAMRAAGPGMEVDRADVVRAAIRIGLPALRAKIAKGTGLAPRTRRPRTAAG